MHGSYGSPDENWFRWLEKELKALGHEVILEQFPVDNWNEIEELGEKNSASYLAKESLISWENFFTSFIMPKLQGEKFNFVGHSIAPVFMLHMLSKYNLTLNKAIFVAPFFNIPNTPNVWQFYPVNKTFYSYDFDFATLNKRIDKSYVVYGDNDPYVPNTEPVLFAQKLNSETIVIPNGRHCGSNFKEFPILINLLNN